MLNVTFLTVKVNSIDFVCHDSPIGFALFS